MLSVKLTFFSPPSLSLTLLPLCLLPQSPLFLPLFLFSSSSPSLSCPFHTDAPSRPAWQEWWDVSNRYYTYPNILHCKQGDWLGGREYFGIIYLKHSVWHRRKADTRQWTSVQVNHAVKAIFTVSNYNCLFCFIYLFIGGGGGKEKLAALYSIISI